jgi:Ca-activated chloride channel homolog
VHWAEPAYIWLVLLSVPATILIVLARRRQIQDMRRLTGGGTAAPRFPFWKAVIYAMAFLLFVAALCRPQWGEVDVRQQSRGIDIIVALDVSTSMLADDLAPTRLTAARGALMRLLPLLRGDRIGLIAFAGSAFMVCPLTRDYDTFANTMRDVDGNAVPLGGTSLTPALMEAKRGFSAADQRGKVLLLVTDGEDQDVDAAGVLAAAETLRTEGVTVYGVAVGTPSGSLVRFANGEFLRDRQGVLVTSRLHEDALDRITKATGGRRVDLASELTALNTLYIAELSGMDPGNILATRRQLVERFQIPLALALLLLLLEPVRIYWSRAR